MPTSPKKRKYQPIADAAISLVPNWYKADCGPHRYSVSVEGEEYSFYSLRRKTPLLDRLYNLMNVNVTNLCRATRNIRSPLFRELVQETFALQWLDFHSLDVKWKDLLYYFRDLSQRTYENHPVTINMVISSKEADSGRRIDLAKRQKFLDQLATSPFTYFRVDRRLKIMGLEEIRWNDVSDSTSYKFVPEFLHPFHSILKTGEFSAHLTAAGDWIFMDAEGLLASRRKGSWKVYDKRTFKNTLTDCMKSYYVGASLFELAFDLSFKRHGALLVYDPDSKVVEKLVNPESRITPKSKIVAGTGQSVVADSVRQIAIGKSTQALRNKRLLTELASIDGAVIFDDDKLLAIGAIIKSHAKAGGQSGARTTAALSAYHWGGRPVKVSSDGEVMLYFASDDDEYTCDATIEFL